MKRTILTATMLLSPSALGAGALTNQNQINLGRPIWR
jgi:hypothetical protein